MTNPSGQASGPALKPGDTIGKYEVQDVLGVGGQSIVYRCFDALLERSVAIKQIATPLAMDDAYLDTLRKNIRTIAKLGAKNEAIVTIHDIIEEPRGLFYVMEFVEGHTLETLIREADGPIETKAVLLILFRLAAALHEVHAAGIVHRDMKPSNIIMTEGLRPKIIDFGVAAVAGSDISMPLATTKYLAPELYSGKNIDGRADIYSLGFIAYEMLLGRETFNEVFDDIVRDKHSEALRWMKWHGNENVLAPPLHEVNPTMPLSLSHIVARMMEKDPQRRFQNAEELGRAIKSSFSPKGKQRGGVAPAAPVSRGASRMSQISRPAGIGTLEGDELEITGVPTNMGITPGAPGTLATNEMFAGPEGPATAPLPKGPMTRKTKVTLIAAGIVVLVAMISVGVVLLIQAGRAGELKAKDAVALYQNGKTFLGNGQYAEALEKFQQLRKDHGETVQAQCASVYVPMCEAHIAIERHHWDEAQVAERQARQAAERLQESSDDEKIVKFTRERLDEIEKIGNKSYSFQIILTAIQKTSDDLNGVQKLTDFDAIAKQLDREVTRPDVSPTDSQSKRIKTLQREILRRKFEFAFHAQVALADQQASELKFDDAKVSYDDALAMINNDDNAKLLLPAVRQKFLSDTRKKLDTLQRLRGESNAMETLRNAREKNDPAAIRVAIQDVLKLPNLPADERKALEVELKNIATTQTLVEARKLYEDGNFAGAKAKYTEVITLDPQNAEAKSRLVMLKQTDERQGFILAGDKLYSQNKFDLALAQYREAARCGGRDKNLDQKINDAQYQIELEKARAFEKAKQYDNALASYNRAKGYKPEMAAQVESYILAMRTTKEFEETLKQGDEALRQNKFAEAIKWYEQAQKIKNDPIVATRINLTYYKKHVFEGKEALEAGNIPLARWNFKKAQEKIDTPEVKELLKKVSGENGN